MYTYKHIYTYISVIYVHNLIPGRFQVETILVHAEAAKEFLPAWAARAAKEGIELRGCPATVKALGSVYPPFSVACDTVLSFSQRRPVSLYSLLYFTGLPSIHPLQYSPSLSPRRASSSAAAPPL